MTSRPPENVCVITREPSPASLKLNHCSTTRDSTAAAEVNRSPRPQHPDLPEQMTGTQTSRVASGYPMPLPQRTRPGPPERV